MNKIHVETLEHVIQICIATTMIVSRQKLAMKTTNATTAVTFLLILLRLFPLGGVSLSIAVTLYATLQHKVFRNTPNMTIFL